jgi:hypothetical protein
MKQWPHVGSRASRWGNEGLGLTGRAPPRGEASFCCVFSAPIRVSQPLDESRGAATFRSLGANPRSSWAAGPRVSNRCPRPSPDKSGDGRGQQILSFFVLAPPIPGVHTPGYMLSPLAGLFGLTGVNKNVTGLPPCRSRLVTAPASPVSSVASPDLSRSSQPKHVAPAVRIRNETS